MSVKKKNDQIFSFKPKKFSVDLFYHKQIKYLVFKDKTFFQLRKIPFYISVQKKKNFFIFQNFLSDFSLKFFELEKFLVTLNNSFNKTFKKKLILKGLGMRIKYIENSHLLQLKLGFSYLVNLLVPKNLKIFTNKNLLIIEGSNAAQVGNFTTLVRSLRYPNAYNGKGFWLKYETIKLKQVKKT